MKYNILITSSGGNNGVNVIQALKKEREWQKKWKKEISAGEFMDFNLIAVDSDPLAAGLFLADKGYVCPVSKNEKKFVSFLLKLCKREKIDALIPVSDRDLFIISERKKDFKNVKMALSKHDIYKKTENKSEMGVFFRDNGFLSPKIYFEKHNNFTVENFEVKYPSVIKPLEGSGSQGVEIVKSERELSFYADKLKTYLVQEFIEGTEYTIDGLCDLKGKMVYALPRIRLEVKGGMAVKSITEYNKELIDRAKEITEKLKLIGCFNIQAIKRKNKYYFIEVNNRFGSGGLPLAVGAGLNIPADIIRLLFKKKIAYFRKGKSWLYNETKMTRYSEAIILNKKNQTLC